MTFPLYDYVNESGENEFKSWTSQLQTKERAKLNEKLDKLTLHGDELYPQMLTGTSVAGIQKLRVHGQVQLRPLLCKGPLLNNGVLEEAYTLLMGAKEVGSAWKPADAPQKANNKKQAVIESRGGRRQSHERVR